MEDWGTPLKTNNLRFDSEAGVTCFRRWKVKSEG